METRYDKYKKLNKEELYILGLYFKKIEINISGITLMEHRSTYNTMDFQIYKIKYLFKNIGKKIKKGIPKCYFNPNFYKLALILAIIIQFIDYYGNIAY